MEEAGFDAKEVGTLAGVGPQGGGGGGQQMSSSDSSEDGTSSVDTKSFDGILKAINNQNNNSQINTYLQNTTTSSLFGYA